MVTPSGADFWITNATVYVPIVTLINRDYIKLLKESKWDLKCSLN